MTVEELIIAGLVISLIAVVGIFRIRHEDRRSGK